MASKFKSMDERIKVRDLQMVPVETIKADHSTNTRFAPGDSEGIRRSFLERIERGEHPQINPIVISPSHDRSEERRVGKECRL